MVKISVCIPTYNRAHLLPEAIRSVLNQTDANFELIVCDDGSTDHTAEVMIGFTAEVRVHYIRHPYNIGRINNIRSGFERARGDYFIKLDDDDRLTPDFLARTAAILDADPAIDFVGTDHWLIDRHGQRNRVKTELNSYKCGRITLPAGPIDHLLHVVFVQQSLQVGATLFRRQVLDEVGLMRSNIQYCEDHDLFVRLALAGKQAHYLPDRLMEYRVHAEQQGLQRAIPYLKGKIRYLENFQFGDRPLEQVRQFRLAEAKLLLGLRLIETGDTQMGRELVRAGQAVSTLRRWAGLGLSFLPLNLPKRC